MTMLNKEFSTDFSKRLSDWALAAGRLLQSQQTGCIHLYYGEHLEQAQTIPLMENVLFVLALLRSRLIEQVQEAKNLLKKILVFQHMQTEESKGNFPVYLHEYPECRDPALGLQFLAPFYWILIQFGHILGPELKHMLEESVRLILEFSLKTHEIRPFPYSLAVRLFSAQYAFGCLWKEQKWKQQGQQKLDDLNQQQLTGWYSTSHLSDILVGLQMVYPSIMESPWQKLWHHLEQTWHFQTGCYIGPNIREWQEKEEPSSHLYDLFAGYFAGQFSKRAMILKPYHLQGILIQATADKFTTHSPSFPIKGSYKNQHWQTVAFSNWAYTVLEKQEPTHPSAVKTYTPFRLIWGDLQFVHSLVCQGGREEKITYQLNEQDLSIQLTYDLADHLVTDEKSVKEIEFFMDFQSTTSFTLNGSRTNTFELNQTIVFSYGSYQVSCLFELIEGQGHFLGHVMRGNRPSQIELKAEKRFQAYDWTFFLRTIRRQGPCRIRVTLSLQDFPK